ncbi:MAG: GH3 auxin-responsive promoter family protein [Bacteroidia bacterium]|nr:GH3 auxin-responsive promoter family protein [Bacteroidia bacterium]
MSFKSFLSKPFANYIAAQVRTASLNAIEHQQKVFESLIQVAKITEFGKDHNFDSIKTYENFKANIPIRDYEALKSYIDKVREGERDVLWKGVPLYLSKTSGTTSGSKYIPISKESMPNHINSARNALLMYIVNSGNASFVSGKMIFLSGSPEMEKINNILVGRLSGIVNHHVPGYLRSNQLPTYKTNCIDDWESKLDAIIDETIDQKMALISGIPPWVQMYFEKLTERSGKKIKELFPDFSLFVHGGVNFEPYKSKFEESIGGKVDYLETYPASEGFIAYQDTLDEEGLLLTINSGIFYEFIPVSEFFNEDPTRISLKDIELGVNYAIILNTNAGLWGYNIGDTVKFVNKDPYRLVVTGRIKQFISAQGEHVIVEEVENALLSAANDCKTDVVEFTVAPQLESEDGIAYHEWFVEFGKTPESLQDFSDKVDLALQQKNSYYKDLRDGNMLRNLIIRVMQKDAFRNYMKSKGKLGGQNKVPRLSNDRKLVEELVSYIKEE